VIIKNSDTLHVGNVNGNVKGRKENERVDGIVVEGGVDDAIEGCAIIIGNKYNSSNSDTDNDLNEYVIIIPPHVYSE
jgi:hypothetical protein